MVAAAAGTIDANAAVLAEAAAWAGAGRRGALALVIATWGSAPRPVGSLLACDDSGGFIGSVSGGCVEAAVIDAGARVITAGRPERLAFTVSNDRAWEVGLACGGRIEVLVVPLPPPAVLAPLVARLGRGEAAALAVDLGDGGATLADDGAAAAAIARERSECQEVDGRQRFVAVFPAPPRLVIVGAVHIAEPLAAIAGLAGYRVSIVEPRPGFAGRDRFAGATIIAAWPDEALPALAIDAATAVVTLTHDPKLDDPALRAALAGPAFYVGCLGSRKTHAARQARLAAAGCGGDDLARLRGPVGLAIGARTPAEIAIAILAEITLVRRGGGGGDG